MSKPLTDTEIANKALEFLQDRKHTYQTRTKQIVHEINRNFTTPGVFVEHQVIRNVLNRLYQKGVVSREGAGSFRWRILVDSWDHSMPFKMQAGAPMIPKKEPKPHYHAPSPDATEPTSSFGLDETDFLAIVEALKTVKILKEEVAELSGIKDEVKSLKAELQRVKEQSTSYVKILEVKKYDGKAVKLKNKVLPRQFQKVFDLAKCRRNILLVGPAGCGKTYLAKLIADSLGLEFSALSCTAGVGESHLLGRSVPDLTHGKNRFQSTPFLNVFENGGLKLLDEFDAADPNFALCINTGLANGYLNVPNRPDKPVALKHEDFVCIATANTFGRGATRMYVGRGQLDEATLDRFRIGIVECDYDPSVEKAVCPDIGGEEGRSFSVPAVDDEDDFAKRIADRGYNLHDTLHYIRHKIEQSDVRRIMSTRFMEDAYVMVKRGGWSIQTVVETFLSGWTDEEKAKVVS